MTAKKLPPGFKVFDLADVLNTPGRIKAYLDEVAADGDADEMAYALGVVARAGNMRALARETGKARSGLIKTLSNGGNPTLDTVVKVLAAHGLVLSFALKPDTTRGASKPRKARRTGARTSALPVRARRAASAPRLSAP
jgi:probable addiction module antidote protein